MPTQFPTPDFDFQFAQARESIQQYFDYGRLVEVTTRCHDFATEDPKVNPYGPLPKSQARICHEIANEHGLSASYTYQARKTARTFTNAQVEELLGRFYEARYLPCRETFISISRIPDADRADWVEAIIENNWSTPVVKEMSILEYGNRSNGGRTKKPPRTLHQARRQLGKLDSHMGVIFDLLRHVQEGTTNPPDGIDFRVPRSVMPTLRDCAAGMKAVLDQLAAVAQAGRRRQAV